MDKIRATFRCKFCGSEHLWPSLTGLGTERELNKLVHGPTEICPGNPTVLMPAHWEPLLNGDCTKHKHQFELVEITVQNTAPIAIAKDGEPPI